VSKNPLEWFGHRRFVLGITVLVIILSGIILAPGPLFHSYEAVSSANDPLKPLWFDCMPDSSTFKSILVTFSPTNPCTNGAVGASFLNLTPNSTNPAIAIDQTPISISEASSKVLEIDQTIAISPTGNRPPVFGFYLTRNNTLPLTQGYVPANDASVAFLVEFFFTGVSQAVDTFIQRTPTQSISSAAGKCNNSGSFFSCMANGLAPPTNQLLQYSAQLNYTGVTNTPSLSSFTFEACPGFPCGINLSDTETQLPELSLTGDYYLGIFSLPVSSPMTMDFYASLNPPNGNPFNVNNQNSMVMGIFTPNPPATQPPPFIDTGGFFGPVIRALISIGVFILNAILGFIAFIAPALISAIRFLETQIQTILDFIGNALGFGNIGTQLFTFLNQVAAFFTNFLPTGLSNFPTFMSRFFDYLNIVFPVLPSAFATALTVLTFAVNGISQALTIFIFGIQFITAAYAFFLIFSFMVFTADDALSGVIEYLGTAEALAFFLIKWAALITNLGLDLGTWIIGLIPKPVIQMAAARLPRIPILESSARIILPSFDFGELRAGNLLAPWLWTLGFWFDTWYESRNPALPGSLCNLVASTCTNMQLLNNLLPLMQIFVFMSSGVLALWLVMRPLELLGADLGIFESIGISLGRKPVGGPGGISIAKAQKHFQGRLQRAVEKRKGVQGFKAVGPFSPGAKLEKGVGTKEAVSTGSLFE